MPDELLLLLDKVGKDGVPPPAAPPCVHTILCVFLR
jgi:hypothetical protein